MEKWDLTKGHHVLILFTPANDLSLHYKTVGSCIKRLQEIKNLSVRETAYQVTLTDVRKTIDNLPNFADSWWKVHYLAWGLTILFVISLITVFLHFKLET